MTQQDILKILNRVADGTITPESALNEIKIKPYEDLGFANVDTSRSFRTGFAEVIYGEGKTKEQIKAIACSLVDNGEKTVLITRLDSDKASYLSNHFQLEYDELAKLAIVGKKAKISGKGRIVVACAGTSDLYCAREVALTAEALGNDVECIFDVGVAGIHRLLERVDTIASARVVVAVAGMEGALASVVGGLTSAPVIAVPTSVGYGASFGGVSSLLSMLNSCASNVSVVNIDNGFGAGYLASVINHLD